MRVRATLDAYDGERSDFERIIGAVRKIQSASEAALRDEEWLIELIRDIGLVPIPDAEISYAEDADCINGSMQGLIQIPREFARWLLLAGEEKPASFIEIGCFNGATATITTAYLQRFNPALRAVTVDVWPTFIFHHLVRDLIPLEYVVGKTSYDFRGQTFDCAFIDGDHSFDWAWADYQNVGHAARICALHDINNEPYLHLPNGGVPAVWELIRREEEKPGVRCLEFCNHPTRAIMGIGARVRRI